MMKKFLTVLVLGLAVFAVSCSKEEDKDLITVTAKTASASSKVTISTGTVQGITASLSGTTINIALVTADAGELAKVVTDLVAVADAKTTIEKLITVAAVDTSANYSFAYAITTGLAADGTGCVGTLKVTDDSDAKVEDYTINIVCTKAG